MSLEEVDNKGIEQNSDNIIKINCRGKTVYVPYYTALKYDFLRSYLENWKDKQEVKELNIDDYPPELLQSEIDEKTLSVPISTFLGYDNNNDKYKKYISKIYLLLTKMELSISNMFQSKRIILLWV